MILLCRPDPGEPLAVMDGRSIPEMRTAAVTKYVALRGGDLLHMISGGGLRSRSDKALERKSRIVDRGNRGHG